MRRSPFKESAKVDHFSFSGNPLTFEEYMKKEDQLSSQMIALERWFQIERDMEEILSASNPNSAGPPRLGHLRGFKGWSYPVTKDKVGRMEGGRD